MLNEILLLLTLSTFLTGGNLHPVVVEKTFRPLPLTDSLGVSGIYRLELRDKNKKISRQMVSAEIFAAYEVGDEFNTRATPAAIRRQRLLRAEMMEVVARTERVETKPAVATALVTASVPAPAPKDSRVAQNFRKHDMLPETEGF
jgi:hypothetical protein